MVAPDPAVVERQYWLNLLGWTTDNPALSMQDLRDRWAASQIIDTLDTNIRLENPSKPLASSIQSVAGGGGGGGTGGSGSYVPLLIFNGESNSGGFADNNNGPSPGELAPRSSVQIWDNAGMASFQTLDIGTNNEVGHDQIPNGTYHGWELGLANSVETTQWATNTVYLVKTGQGGSRINNWAVGGQYWQLFLDRTRGAISLLRSQGKTPLIYFWYSLGINDALAGMDEASWKSQVQAYFVRIRTELGFVPIFYAHNPDTSIGATFNDSIDAMAAADSMITTIDATGATTKPDGHHWDYAGMKLLASRFVSASTYFGQNSDYEHRRIDKLAGSGGGGGAAPSTPSIVRAPSTVSFKEGSAGSPVAVTLSIAPAANVIVATAVAGGNAVCTPNSVTFTTSNWNVAQNITITSPDDGTQSGDRTSTVTLSSAGVTGPVTVGVTITDAYVAPGPVNTVLPTISGTIAIGAVQVCSTGTWTGSPTGYTYQWILDGTNIAGATANTYTILSGDMSHSLTCRVTATNGQGSNSVITAPVSLNKTVSPIVWSSMTNTQSLSAGKIEAIAGGTAGAMDATPVDLTQPFELHFVYPAAGGGWGKGICLLMDDDNTINYVWTGQIFVFGIFDWDSTLYAATSAVSTPSTGQTVSAGDYTVKMVKNGNDVDFFLAYGAGAFGAKFYTASGVLSGKTTGYIKAIWSNPAAGSFIFAKRG